MSMRAIEELIDEIKEGLTAPQWSQAVLCVRRGDAILHHREGQRCFYDVKMGRRLPYRVELEVEDLDWHCPCASPSDTCAHAAAAALALKRASGEGAERDAPSVQALESGDHLGYRLWSVPGSWVFRVAEVRDGAEETPLKGRPDPEIPLRAYDKELLALPGWSGQGDAVQLSRIPPSLFQHFLTALSLCPDVKVDGRPVRVRTEPLKAALIVEDHPQGIRVRLGPPGRHHLTLPGPVPLVVVGDPAALRPLGASGLPAQEVTYYEGGPIFPPGRIPHFLETELPRLERYGRVSITAKALPQLKELQPYPLLRLMPAEGGLDAIAAVAYGKPPIALVAGSKLVATGKGDVLPRRIPRAEDRIDREIRDITGLTPGKRRTLRGVAAARFVSDILPRFRGEVTGRKAAEAFQILDAPLLPTLSAGAPGQGPALGFAMEGAAGRADPQAVLQAWREGRGLVPLLEGGFGRLPLGWLEENAPLLEAIFEARGEGGESIRRIAQAQLAETAPDSPDTKTLKAAARAILEIPTAPLPAGVRATLRPYQQEGVDWLRHLERQRLGGCLADDMGLGKTLQALCVVAGDLGAGAPAAPTLVVAPRSVIENWQSEAARFVPDLPTRLYHGPARSLEGVEGAMLVVTTYALLRRDERELGEIPWGRIILDEAQAIKNPDSLVSQAARRLKARSRFALTGTPVENHLRELWSILDFVNPGMLGSRRGFEERYGAIGGVGDQRALSRLRVRITPFVLRRLKQDVAKDLPGKTEVVIKCALSRAERKVYDALLKAGRSTVQRLLEEKGVARGRMEILEQLLRLRQAACHPALVPGAGDAIEGPSAKIRLLLEQLEVILDEGHKALVFSQWTSLLDHIEPALKAADIPWVRLDGSTRDRKGAVDRFQAEGGPGVFLISLKAGGTGLNLTAADYVYLMDPWWNPAVEQQAIDRTYRIGQTRPVVATRLVATATVEERILALQDKKRAMAEAALGGEAEWVGGLSESELEALFD